MSILKISVLAALIITPTIAIAESLECAMLRQQIISASRQSSEDEFQQRQLALAQLGPQEQQAYQMAEAGRAIGRAVGKAFGAQTQQEHDIQIYKQNCE
jgi:hypothetical protein